MSPQSINNGQFEMVEQAYELGNVLSETNLANTAAGQIAIKAVYAAANEQFSTLPQDEITQIANSYSKNIEEISKLEFLNNELKGLNLSTHEVEGRITEARASQNPRDTLIAGFITIRSLINLSSNISHTQELTPPVVNTQEQREVEDLPTISIHFLTDDKRGYLKIGNRQIPLSKANGANQNDYAPMRFAATAILSELLPGGEMPVRELWDKMHKMIGFDETPPINRDEMAQIRSYITGITYRNQQLFVHNGAKRGSAYGVNPDLKFDIALESNSDANISEFAKHLVRLTEYRNTVQDSEQTPEVQSKVLPTPLELYAFLVKLDSSMQILGDAIKADDMPMIVKMKDLAKEMVVAYEAYDEIRSPEITTDTELLRTEVTDKFIEIATDDKLLNDLLNEVDAGVLYSLYGEDLSHQILELITTILDMNTEEKDLLRHIIEAREKTEVTLYAGSHSKGVDILGVTKSIETPKGTFSNAPAMETTPYGTFDDESGDDIEDADTEDANREYEYDDNLFAGNASNAIVESTNIITTKKEAPVIEPSESVQPHETASEVATIEKRPTLESLVDKHIAQVLDKGIQLDQGISSRQAEAMLGLSTAHIVNARENNRINENSRVILSAADVISILIFNDSDKESRQLLQNPKNRKQVNKLINSKIKLLLSQA